ncbi:holotricin-3-like isoform X2 [Dreissena polymorpha]|uniref:holotricin-3-like isoform X2 n=1 Tax=Dreissena polymorpha TaxID=45954 RepID=UPI0022641917|nr:holotricin-3-like isoform X2 [Dreissena polymorpha]
MNPIIFASVALAAVVGLVFADEFNFGNNFDDGYGGGYGYGLGSLSIGSLGGGYGHGSSFGSGYGQAAYIPVPVGRGGSGSSGLSGLLPLLGLLFLLPLLFNRNTATTSDQILLINSTLTGGK